MSTARVFGVEMLSITIMALSHRHSQRGIIVYLEKEDYLVRLGKVRLGKVRLGKVRLGKVRIGKVRLGKVRLGLVT